MSGSLDQAIVPVINFTQIPPPGALLVPGVYVEIDADYTNIGLLPFPARILVIGQAHFAAGTAAANTVYPITRSDQGASLFGAGSPLADAIAAVFASNPGIPVDAIAPASNSSSTPAMGSITFGGAATYAGTQAIGLCGFRVTFSIATTDTPALMASNFIAAAEAVFQAQNLPVGLGTNSTAGEVVITTTFSGLLANQLDVRANPAARDTTVPGVTITIAPIGNSVTGTPATGVLDITAALAAIATTWYTDICCCFTDPTALGLLQTALASRYTAMQNVDSTCYVTFKGTQGQIAADIAGIDCPYMVAMGVTNPQDAPWKWSGVLTGVAAAALMNDPARQLRGLALPGITAPAPADRLYEPEQQALLADGISTFQVAPDGSVLIQRLVSTYTESPLGVPDTAWQDIMTAKVMTRIRYDWKNYLLLNYPNAKLAPDGSLAAEYDPSVATPKRIQAAWAARCTLYERAGWIVNSATTSAQSVFYIDPSDKNRLDSQRYLVVIGNLMVDAEQLLFAA